MKIARIYVTATGCTSIIRAEHFDAMLEDSIVCNIGHFDCEIDVDYLNNNCTDKDLVQPQVRPPLSGAASHPPLVSHYQIFFVFLSCILVIPASPGFCIKFLSNCGIAY